MQHLLTKNDVDTFYYWNTQSLTEENNIWLKITGYSCDTTIINYSVKKLKSNLTAVKLIEYQEHIILYPNPSTGVFTIEGENIQKVEVIDIIGRTIYSSLPDQTRQSIDLSARQKGMYFVKVTTDKGTAIKKLIIK